ncbi:MAG TPA: HAMP domain-containing sensor histidine kinase [Candidatus Acidoferrum sp.]|nr:HAMP domain-containing sensor histidine kinase [Candidatus Acidoferrum sp.]
MSKRKARGFPSHLGLEVISYLLIAFFTAVGIYLCADYFTNEIIYERFSTIDAIAQETEQDLNNFSRFVEANHLSTGDTETINNWLYGQKYILMSIYKDEYLVYSNYPDYVKSENGLPALKWGGLSDPQGHHLYDVSFSDGRAQVEIYTLAASKVYSAVQFTELVLAFGCFILVFLTLFSSKFQYIDQLQNEMEIIGSGNLDFPVTIKGNDEIAFLAGSIDEMRRSFLERTKTEYEARRANSELITSISHDIRTPLTVLIGNLDLLANKKFQSEEQQERYLENCRKKAYQLKELTDKLFQYFLVFGDAYREPALERMDGYALLEQMVGEYALALEDAGFTVSIHTDPPKAQECAIEANVIAVRRVFDNLFGNIRKYARPGSAIEVAVTRGDGSLSVRICNAVEETPQEQVGTRIGLATCQKIMAQHGGAFATSKTANEFCATVSFPLIETAKPTEPTGGSGSR